MGSRVIELFVKPAVILALAVEVASTAFRANGDLFTYARNHVFHTELVRPAATAWDLRILERLWRALERYVRFGSRRADRDGSDARFPDPAPKRALLAAYRSGDPDAVREATLRNIDAQERIGGRGLERVRP